MRQKQRVFSLFLLSPSSRRAWIEISTALAGKADKTVALLTEGVDRNSSLSPIIVILFSSPSSRRAWIEIMRKCPAIRHRCCRPPHGGRG